MNKKLLVLDLDETLFYATEVPLNMPEDHTFKKYYVYKRPGLDQFLTNIALKYDIAIWTSSTTGYAENMVQRFIPKHINLKFLWTRDQCHLEYIPKFNSFFFAKDLKKVSNEGFDLKDVLVVDDSPEKYKNFQKNMIRVKAFMGEHQDPELTMLIDFLPTLLDCDDVRQIDKRNWRYKIMLDQITETELVKWKKKSASSSDCGLPAINID